MKEGLRWPAVGARVLISVTVDKSVGAWVLNLTEVFEVVPLELATSLLVADDATVVALIVDWFIGDVTVVFFGELLVGESEDVAPEKCVSAENNQIYIYFFQMFLLTKIMS